MQKWLFWAWSQFFCKNRGISQVRFSHNSHVPPVFSRQGSNRLGYDRKAWTYGHPSSFTKFKRNLNGSSTFQTRKVCIRQHNSRDSSLLLRHTCLSHPRYNCPFHSQTQTPDARSWFDYRSLLRWIESKPASRQARAANGHAAGPLWRDKACGATRDCCRDRLHQVQKQFALRQANRRWLWQLYVSYAWRLCRQMPRGVRRRC